MFKKILIYLIAFILPLSGCGSNIFKRADVEDVHVNVNERVKKNIEEGRGIRFGKGKGQGGTFDFASSNELWRASIEVLDFVTFNNASYSGGILITEWFDGNSTEQNNRNLKITVRFLTNEIRSDAIDVDIFIKQCSQNLTNCSVNKQNDDLVAELSLSILKKAAIYEKQRIEKYKKENPYEVSKPTKGSDKKKD